MDREQAPVSWRPKRSFDVIQSQMSHLVDTPRYHVRRNPEIATNLPEEPFLWCFLQVSGTLQNQPALQILHFRRGPTQGPPADPSHLTVTCPGFRHRWRILRDAQCCLGAVRWSKPVAIHSEKSTGTQATMKYFRTADFAYNPGIC